MKFLLYSQERQKGCVELKKREIPENIKIFKMISGIKV